MQPSFNPNIAEFQCKSKEKLLKGRFKANPVNNTLHVLTLGFSVFLLCAFSKLRSSYFAFKHKSHRLWLQDDCFRKGGRRVLPGCFSWLTEQESPAVEMKAPSENISPGRQQVIDPAHVNNILSFFKHLEERRLISLVPGVWKICKITITAG